MSKFKRRAFMTGSTDKFRHSQPFIIGSVHKDSDGNIEALEALDTGSGYFAELAFETAETADSGLILSITIRESADSLAEIVSAINTAYGPSASTPYVEADDYEGCLRIKTLNSGTHATYGDAYIRIQPEQSGYIDAAPLLGFPVYPHPNATVTAGDIASAPPRPLLQGNRPGATFLARGEDRLGENFNRALHQAGLNTDSIQARLTANVAVPVVLEILASSTRLQTDSTTGEITGISLAPTHGDLLDAVLQSRVFIGDLESTSSLDEIAKYFSILDKDNNELLSGTDIVRVGAVTRGTPVASVPTFPTEYAAPLAAIADTADLIAADGGQALGVDRQKAPAVQITEVRDNCVAYCEDGEFAASGTPYNVATGDLATVSGSTITSPRNHNGRYVVGQVISETEVELLPFNDSSGSLQLLNQDPDQDMGDLTISSGGVFTENASLLLSPPIPRFPEAGSIRVVLGLSNLLGEVPNDFLLVPGITASEEVDGWVKKHLWRYLNLDGAYRGQNHSDAGGGFRIGVTGRPVTATSLRAAGPSGGTLVRVGTAAAALDAATKWLTVGGTTDQFVQDDVGRTIKLTYSAVTEEPWYISKWIDGRTVEVVPRTEKEHKAAGWTGMKVVSAWAIYEDYFEDIPALFHAIVPDELYDGTIPSTAGFIYSRASSDPTATDKLDPARFSFAHIERVRLHRDPDGTGTAGNISVFTGSMLPPHGNIELPFDPTTSMNIMAAEINGKVWQGNSGLTLLKVLGGSNTGVYLLTEAWSNASSAGVDRVRVSNLDGSIPTFTTETALCCFYNFRFVAGLPVYSPASSATNDEKLFGGAFFSDSIEQKTDRAFGVSAGWRGIGAGFYCNVNGDDWRALEYGDGSFGSAVRTITYSPARGISTTHEGQDGFTGNSHYDGYVGRGGVAVYVEATTFAQQLETETRLQTVEGAAAAFVQHGTDPSVVVWRYQDAATGADAFEQLGNDEVLIVGNSGIKGTKYGLAGRGSAVGVLGSVYQYNPVKNRFDTGGIYTEVGTASGYFCWPMPFAQQHTGQETRWWRGEVPHLGRSGKPFPEELANHVNGADGQLSYLVAPMYDRFNFPHWGVLVCPEHNQSSGDVKFSTDEMPNWELVGIEVEIDGTLFDVTSHSAGRWTVIAAAFQANETADGNWTTAGARYLALHLPIATDGTQDAALTAAGGWEFGSAAAEVTFRPFGRRWHQSYVDVADWMEVGTRILPNNEQEDGSDESLHGSVWHTYARVTENQWISGGGTPNVFKSYDEEYPDHPDGDGGSSRPLLTVNAKGTYDSTETIEGAFTESPHGSGGPYYSSLPSSSGDASPVVGRALSEVTLSGEAGANLKKSNSTLEKEVDFYDPSPSYGEGRWGKTQGPVDSRGLQGADPFPNVRCIRGSSSETGNELFPSMDSYDVEWEILDSSEGTNHDKVGVFFTGHRGLSVLSGDTVEFDEAVLNLRAYRRAPTLAYSQTSFWSSSFGVTQGSAGMSEKSLWGGGGRKLVISQNPALVDETTISNIRVWFKGQGMRVDPTQRCALTAKIVLLYVNKNYFNFTAALRSRDGTAYAVSEEITVHWPYTTTPPVPGSGQAMYREAVVEFRSWNLASAAAMDTKSDLFLTIDVSLDGGEGGWVDSEAVDGGYPGFWHSGSADVGAPDFVYIHSARLLPSSKPLHLSGGMDIEGILRARKLRFQAPVLGYQTIGPANVCLLRNQEYGSYDGSAFTFNTTQEWAGFEYERSDGSLKDGTLQNAYGGNAPYGDADPYANALSIGDGGTSPNIYHGTLPDNGTGFFPGWVSLGPWQEGAIIEGNDVGLLPMWFLVDSSVYEQGSRNSVDPRSKLLVWGNNYELGPDNLAPYIREETQFATHVKADLYKTSTGDEQWNSALWGSDPGQVETRMFMGIEHDGNGDFDPSPGYVNAYAMYRATRTAYSLPQGWFGSVTVSEPTWYEDNDADEATFVSRDANPFVRFFKPTYDAGAFFKKGRHSAAIIGYHPYYDPLFYFLYSYLGVSNRMSPLERQNLAEAMYPGSGSTSLPDDGIDTDDGDWPTFGGFAKQEEYSESDNSPVNADFYQLPGPTGFMVPLDPPHGAVLTKLDLLLSFRPDSHPELQSVIGGDATQSSDLTAIGDNGEGHIGSWPTDSGFDRGGEGPSTRTYHYSSNQTWGVWYALPGGIDHGKKREAWTNKEHWDGVVGYTVTLWRHNALPFDDARAHNYYMSETESAYPYTTTDNKKVPMGYGEPIARLKVTDLQDADPRKYEKGEYFSTPSINLEEIADSRASLYVDRRQFSYFVTIEFYTGPRRVIHSSVHQPDGSDDTERVATPGFHPRESAETKRFAPFEWTTAFPGSWPRAMSGTGEWEIGSHGYEMSPSFVGIASVRPLQMDYTWYPIAVLPWFGKSRTNTSSGAFQSFWTGLDWGATYDLVESFEKEYQDNSSGKKPFYETHCLVQALDPEIPNYSVSSGWTYGDAPWMNGGGVALRGTTNMLWMLYGRSGGGSRDTRVPMSEGYPPCTKFRGARLTYATDRAGHGGWGG